LGDILICLDPDPDESETLVLTEFWIYSVYGKFYLKVVRSASLAVGADYPRMHNYVYPPKFCAQKSRAILFFPFLGDTLICLDPDPDETLVFTSMVPTFTRLLGYVGETGTVPNKCECCFKGHVLNASQSILSSEYLIN
jgi:hypothetical protein